MPNEIVIASGDFSAELEPKLYDGKRVVTFKDIDTVHNRVAGTARKRFNDNKRRFIEGVDYFVRKTDEAKKEYGIVAPNGLTLVTESGYLMIVKLFTDDLAWDVQRQLVNVYFKAQDEEPKKLMRRNAPLLTDRAKDSKEWYNAHSERMSNICAKKGWSRKQLYHLILQELSFKYDMREARRIVKAERGTNFLYAMDVVGYFDDMAEDTEAILTRFENEIET